MSLRSLQRAARRFARLLRSAGADFVYSGRYAMDLPGSPLDPRRAEHLLTFLSAEGLIRRGDLRWPRLAEVRTLARTHTADYLDAVLRPGALLRIVGTELSAAEEESFLGVQRAMVGGTVLATRLTLTRGRPAINLGGGLHHAHADRGAGFCVFNDVAIAVAQAREGGFAKPILIVDLDLHDGDGTRSIFAADPTVHTFSIHNRPWDDAPAVASTAVALGSEVEDGAYLEALERHLPPVVAEVEPGLVYYLAGCDPAADDELGDWRITAEGMVARDRFVVASLRAAVGRVPLVVLLAGGYGSGAWRYSARFLSWLLARNGPIEPPSTEGVTLLRYRALRDLVPPSDLTGGAAEDEWGLTEEDIFPGVVPRRSRFLEFYSTHGVELGLERLGFLTRLREKGFARPTVEFDLDHPAGQTVRIWGDESQRELVLELRVRIDRRSLPGMKVLFVEWLLLQNPRADFGRRRRLPGQAHPGLGLLREVVAMLVLICDRLELDGVAFVPAHFHLAAQSRKYLRFLDPEHQGRFEALCRALEAAGLHLAEATRAVAAGRVVDAGSGEPFVWQPTPMVIPASDRLRRLTTSEEYETAVREAAGRYAFEVAAGPPGRPPRDREGMR